MRGKFIVNVLSRSNHCVKSVRIWNFSGPCFPACKLNTETYRENRLEYGHVLHSEHLRGFLQKATLQISENFNENLHDSSQFPWSYKLRSSCPHAYLGNNYLVDLHRIIMKTSMTYCNVKNFIILRLQVR